MVYIDGNQSYDYVISDITSLITAHHNEVSMDELLEVAKKTLSFADYNSFLAEYISN